MHVSEAILSRMMCRAFLPTPVPRCVIEDILERAARAPSGGNLQPWKIWVLAGEPLASLERAVCARIAAGEFAEIPAEHFIYPLIPKEPYESRKFLAGEAMYAALGISRDDHAGRMAQILRNFECFGAPACLFFAIDRDMQPGQWAELGMLMMNVMLLAREVGLHTAPIGAWSMWHRTLRDRLRMPDELMLYCGMGLGHADPEAPVNAICSPRAPLAEFAVFEGF